MDGPMVVWWPAFGVFCPPHRHLPDHLTGGSCDGGAIRILGSFDLPVARLALAAMDEALAS